MADFLQFATAPPGTDNDLARMFLIPLDPNSGERLVGPLGGVPGIQPEDLPTIQLQYWPETVTYTRGEIGWQQRNVPGLSHSLYQWTGNGSPSLQFESVFTSDHDPAYTPLESVLPDTDQGTIRDLDLNEVSAWFTAATNPLYADGPTADIPVNPPPVIQLVPESRAPNVSELAGVQSLNLGPAVTSSATRNARSDFPIDAGLGSASEIGTTFSQIDRDFFGIIKDYSVVYEKWWPSGAPRIIRCNITLHEVIQLGGEILPHGRDRNIKVFKTYRLIGNS